MSAASDAADINHACKLLRELAKRSGVDAIRLDVLSDGRIEFSGNASPYTKWVVRGDIDLGISPGHALVQVLK